jgi:hypothetical protein
MINGKWTLTNMAIVSAYMRILGICPLEETQQSLIMSYRSTVIITSSWHFKMALQGVDDGGVEFVRVSDNEPCKTEYKDDGNLSWTTSLGDVAAEFSSEINSYLTLGTTNVENTLLGALENQNKLFLPAAGTFLMKDPLFNKRGDLMVSLAYNG